ncbi:MAG: hypothetical protein RQ754_11470 [Desulfuromonadales bacterium]|nr:hypothetical protein [Desulfuromonadales bacterium]
MRQYLLPLLALFFCPVICFAGSTVSCHCFQQRHYLPQQSHAADPYFLTTAQNSLMAVLYRVEKKSLVRAKMNGAKADDLWIAHDLSRQSGRALTEILSSRSRVSNWGDVLIQLDIDPEQLETRFHDLIGQPEALAASIIDKVLIAELGAGRERVAKLSADRATGKEKILSVFLSTVGQGDPVEIYRRAINGESWGKLLHDSGVYDSAAIEQKWEILLKR